VRFAGQDRALEEGRAVFPLGDRPLVLGPNRLTFTLVLPDGTTERAAVDLEVAYRVFADLGGIDEDPPRLRIRALAQPGTAVEIGGEPIRLDANGQGHRDFVVGGGAEGRGAAAPTEREDHSVVQTVRYRVVPAGGTVEEGEVRARIPLATLALDRPGSSLVTDRSEVAVEGAAHPTATVTIDGTVVPVVDGHFKHMVGLADLGEHVIEVVAREPGAVPDRARISVRRVADLAAEARAYPVDEALTYATVAADPAAHRGRHVGFEGLVYNVEVHRGHSMLQVLVSRCGESRRCPLWVTYPAVTDIQLNNWVRVLGEVDGEQHFRTVGDPSQVMTVPRVRAVYVLPVTR
jgi:hypothetical protein